MHDRLASEITEETGIQNHGEEDQATKRMSVHRRDIYRLATFTGFVTQNQTPPLSIMQFHDLLLAQLPRSYSMPTVDIHYNLIHHSHTNVSFTLHSLHMLIPHLHSINSRSTCIQCPDRPTNIIM